MLRRTTLLGIIPTLFLVIGCAGQSTEGNESDGAGSSEEAEAFLEKAEEVAAEAASPIEPTVPEDGPEAQPGKTIVTIPCAAAAQGCKIAVDQFAEAAEEIGWDTIMIDPEADPGKTADAVNRAVSIEADGIFTVAIDAATIQAPLKAATEAGLEATCFSCVDDTGLMVDVIPNEEQHHQDGYNVAAQAFIDSGADLRAILLRDNEFGNTVRREQGFIDFVEECKEAGASCEIIAEENFLIQNISTSVPQQVVSLARQHPDWNALVAPYDAPLTFILPELRNAGLVGEGQAAYGFDPIDVNINWIREGNVQAATAASPYRWIAYAAVDQLNRAFAGEEPVEQGVKDKLVTSENAPPEGETYLDDGDPSAQFKEIWGVE